MAFREYVEGDDPEIPVFLGIVLNIYGWTPKDLSLIYNPNSFPSVSVATIDWFKAGA